MSRCNAPEVVKSIVTCDKSESSRIFASMVWVAMLLVAAAITSTVANTQLVDSIVEMSAARVEGECHARTKLTKSTVLRGQSDACTAQEVRERVRSRLRPIDGAVKRSLSTVWNARSGLFSKLATKRSLGLTRTVQCTRDLRNGRGAFPVARQGTAGKLRGAFEESGREDRMTRGRENCDSWAGG